MIKFINHDVVQMLIQESSTLPFEFFQAVAVVGIFAIMLILSGHKIFYPTAEPVPSLAFGFGLGVACFAASFFLADRMAMPLKPTIILLDCIFIAGLVGGWRSAITCFVMAAVARYIFGGAVNFNLAVLNYATFIISGVTAHWVFFPKIITEFRISTLFALVVWRFITAMLGLVVLWFVWLNTEVIELLAVRRFLGSFTSSATIVIVAVLLMRYVAERNKQAFVYHVSGLPNLRVFQRFLRGCFMESMDGLKKNRVLLLVEIDNILQLTQAYGHDFMNKKVRQFAEHVVAVVNSNASQHKPLLFSITAKSIAVVLSDTTSAQLQKTGQAHRIFSDIKLFINESPGKIAALISMNVLEISLSQDNKPSHFLRTLFMLEKQDADEVQFLETSISLQLKREDFIRQELARIIVSGVAPLSFQPKVDLQHGNCFGAESLLRLPMKQSDADCANLQQTMYINPQFVIDVAEKCNLRKQLEGAIVKTGIAALAALPPHLNNLCVAVNVTPDMLLQPGFGQFVTELLENAGVEPSRLTIEVIETQRFEMTDETKDSLQKLADFGVVFSLDDFGTGYSSISLLSQLPFSELKLDRSMIHNLGTPRGEAAIQLSIEGAHKYQAHVVAEGIETEEQKNILSKMGIRYGQGYLFAKALPFDEFIAYAEKVQNTDRMTERYPDVKPQLFYA